ncbi:hypothetical protein PG994_008427 [Apiospora phragmitis]|uniref:Acyl-CoA thioesterase 2 C-terminal domain-containing protein n=1 Tax=Apiospora phragmitis TaxID=2905665 RepID=A0ABR1UJE0_9PEZI
MGNSSSTEPGLGHPLATYSAFVLLACISRTSSARLSDVYAGFYTLCGHLHLRTYLDLQRYGPVLRSGPNKLVFKSIEALQDIYNNDRITKSHVYSLTVASGKPSLFNVIDKRHHREKRRLIGHAISDKSLRAFEPTLIDQIDVFLHQLLEALRQTSPVELSERSNIWAWTLLGFWHLAIAALFFYLSRYPKAYKKLAQEVRTSFQSNAEIRNGPQLQSSRCLRACIDEALRMTPPVAGTLWREPYANEYKGGEPFVVDGHVIPPGTQVGVSIYAIHHEETYFPKPFLFQPERWLESDTETLKRMKLAFCPFSTGSRGCAGKSICRLVTTAAAVHLAAFGFVSDEMSVGPALAASPQQIGRGFKNVALLTSLTHNVSFHEPRARIDDWVVLERDTKWGAHGRVLTSQRFWDMKTGRLVMTVSQEALILLKPKTAKM